MSYECPVMLIFACFVDECPRDQNGSHSGNFTSPGYLLKYPNKKRCTWGITVPGDYRMLVTFDEFNTQRNSDFLNIYDGASNSSDMLAILSGDLSGSTYGSSGSSLWFEFTTDGSITARGFHATYTVTQQSSTYRIDSHFTPSWHLESIPLAGVIFLGTDFVSFFCTIWNNRPLLINWFLIYLLQCSSLPFIHWFNYFAYLFMIVLFNM